MSLIERREGIEAGRLDMFVDGAFAFTLTLLAIGGDAIPNSGEKLLLLLRDLPASAMCFAQIALMWHGHVRWRQFCHANTGRGLVLSLMLVFFALVFVYPVHMVYASLCYALSDGWLSPEFVIHSPSDLRAVFACYGLAYACMSGSLVLLFRHAAAQAVTARHDPFKPRMEAVTWSMPAVVGLISAIVAICLPDSTPAWLWPLPGYLYFLLILTGPVLRIFKRRYQRA
ncbi:MAG: hypothetical protein WDW36_006318 [Sanguina aurantia]